jgi:circadian clock protein KaiC
MFRGCGLPPRRPLLVFRFRGIAQQIVRNMRSIGIDLEPWVRKGLLQFHAARPTYGGIEQVLLCY